VPHYIRLIAEGRYDEAYMVNWEANVFPGILGRTCDRPCEPACRRGRVDKEPVATCRLKRAAADFKGDIRPLLPKLAARSNGKRVTLVGGGPASLTVARDLAPLGYRCVVFDRDPKAGGMMRTRIPRFRVPEAVLDEEMGYVLDLGVEHRGGVNVASSSWASRWRRPWRRPAGASTATRRRCSAHRCASNARPARAWPPRRRSTSTCVWPRRIAPRAG
jgi:NADPH-dependent glutamate synthase beta subunit-like oxidoreductase